MKLSSFLQMRSNLFVFRVLGWRIAYYYILILGRLYFFAKRTEKRKVEESIRATFAKMMDHREIACVTRDVFRGVLCHYYEKLFNAYADINKLSSFFEKNIAASNRRAIDEALQKGKGVLFVTGHYGGIEYIPIYLAMMGYPVSVIAKFATKQLKEVLLRRTEPLGLKIIDGSEKRVILRSVIRDLKLNRLVFVECDEIEEWRPSENQRISFLGKRVGLDRTITVLQRKTRAEVVFGVLHRLTLTKYSLIVESYREIKSPMACNTITVGEAVLKSLEKLVYSDPKQWYQWKNFFDIVQPEAVNLKKEVLAPSIGWRSAYV
jgi:KDO2-lipid IV(A) lauroyltransferase